MADRDLFTHDDASTPLTPDERQELIPSHVAYRHELNELEFAAIQEAERWAFSRKRNVLDEAFLRRLHQRMFAGVWRWAGRYRTTARNIGVDAWRIAPDMRTLLDDVRYWIDHESYPPDEIAARFHHRLVWTHPFPNGNGRHARMAADMLLVQLKRSRFSWGRANLLSGDVRRLYIDALRAADRHDFGPLLGFVRS